ncbi:MAG: hypothetical protein KAU06_11075 [Candidatus Marinimicrobia bacterium]|nr:hypothetical protein [Candidatus Neomarinimicrobiota bacterium]
MKRYGILLIGLLAILFMFCEPMTSVDNDINDSDTTAPAIPTGLAKDLYGSIEDTIKIVWDENSESDFSNFKVYKASGIDSLPLYELIAETNYTSHTDIGMSYDTIYYYRISAIDKNDNESEKCEALACMAENIYAPATPVGFTAYGYNIPEIAAPRIELSWSANTESDFSNYRIYRDVDPSFPASGDYLLLETTELSYTDFDVTIGETKYYRITAVDKGLKESNLSRDKSDAPLPQPVLVYPDSSGTSYTKNPAFQWERIDGASRYKVILQKTYSGDQEWVGEIDQQSTDIITLQGVHELAPSTQYYWKVTVYSSDNTVENTHSRTWGFKTPL